MKVAILGGTGKLGLGFVARLLPAAHQIVIGSRDVEKARQAAAGVSPLLKGLSNSDAAAWCDVAIVTVPYAAHGEILAPLKAGLRAKLVIDATVPLNPQNIFQSGTASGKSAAEETDALLADAVVFAAFQTISHRILRQSGHSEDVLVAGPGERKPEVLQLIRDMNLRPIDAGPLAASKLLESMTVLLISINKQNKVKESGLKVTGI